jgi:hypothetical protein
MARKELQHVIEESDACRDFVLAPTFNLEVDCDTGFRGMALNDRSARVRSCGRLGLLRSCHFA